MKVNPFLALVYLSVKVQQWHNIMCPNSFFSFFFEMGEEGYFLIYKSITNMYNILSENTRAYYN